MSYETELANLEAEMVSGRVTRIKPELLAALISAVTDELHAALVAHGHTMDQVSDTGTRMALTPAERANIASAAAAIDLKAPLASPSFTGTPTAPTAVAGTNTTQLATTAFVAAAVAALLNSAPGALDTLDELAAALGDDANFATTVTNLLALKAPLASPSLTGTPTAPTAAPGTNTTQLATTAFAAALAALKAPLDSPSFTGSPTAPTQATSDDTTKLATTAFVKAVVAAVTAGVASFNTRTGAVTLTSGDVTGALGFTPPPNTRSIGVSGLATGGGNLSADRTITVTAASAAEAEAKTEAGKAVVPSALTNFALLNAEDQTLTGGARVTSKSLTTGSITLDPGDRPLQYITNNGAFTITAPANDGSLILLVQNGATAGAITFSGFQVGSSVGDALTTTNGHEFLISVVRINGFATYTIKALQ